MNFNNPIKNCCSTTDMMSKIAYEGFDDLFCHLFGDQEAHQKKVQFDFSPNKMN